MDTADDTILNEFIDYAQEYIRAHIQIKVIDGKMSGGITGENASFQLKYAYLADTTGDTLITTADFTVYGWPNVNDPLQKVELTVSTFDPIRSIIVLADAPSTDQYKKLTCDYSYYTKAINWKFVSLATAYKAAEIWVKREEFLVPERYILGTKRIYQRQPWRYFETEVRRIIDKLTALPMTKVAYKKLVFRPRGPDKPQVDTSAAKEVREKAAYTPDPEIQELHKEMV